MTPKNGKAGAPVLPAHPKTALDADEADPGQVEDRKTEERGRKFGKYGSAPTKPHKPGTEESKGDPKTWIEIELLDKARNPVAGEAYRVTLPDGTTVAEGTLDEKGCARVEGVDPGTCKITFPELEKEAWKAL